MPIGGFDSFRGGRWLAAAALMLLVAGAGVPRAGAGEATPNVLNESAVLRDPEIPVAGNPDGDITIVEFMDYQCPYCRKVHPELLQAVSEDGKIRVVYKDWPIFKGVSIYAAKMVLAAKYQNKFVEAHNALIGATIKLTEPGVRELLAAANVDVDRATRDLAANAKTIEAVLARNDAQARAFQFEGTPAFIVGKFRIPGTLNAATFKLAIADARAALKK